MKFDLTGRSSVPLDRLRGEISKRVENFGKAIAQGAAKKGAETVVRRIGESWATDNWKKLYKGAIRYRETEEGVKFVISAESDATITTHPAETTLVSFSGEGDALEILGSYGKFPVDMIPPLNYRGISYIAEEGVDEETVSARRAALAGTLVSDLSVKLGAILPRSDGFANFDNGQIFDIKFLAKAMELGLPGYKQHKHWGIAAENVRSALEKPSSDVRRAADAALAGADVPTETDIDGQ